MRGGLGLGRRVHETQVIPLVIPSAVVTCGLLSGGYRDLLWQKQELRSGRTEDVGHPGGQQALIPCGTGGSRVAVMKSE